MITRRGLLSWPMLAAAAAPVRPNFVFVLVDDLRFDELGCMGHPFAQTPHCDRLAREGVKFVNAFATTPLCSPSRASFLTGQYIHKHGIVDNTNRSAASHQLVTWPRMLHDAGYRTAFIGKWHMGNDDSPRPGFDEWVSFPGQGVCVDPLINVNGKTAQRRGYITDILTEHAVEFTRASHGKPFCLYLAHKAIHPNIVQGNDGSVNTAGSAEDFIPAERHKELYSGMKLPRRRNYGVVPADKGILQRKLEGVPPLSAATATDDATIYNRLRMMKAIDEGLGRILEALEQTRQLDHTVVVFTSDHGYFYGEHCLNYERRLAYEEAIRIPLLVRYPKAFRAGTTRTDFVLNIDVGPTALDLAGVSGGTFDGVSFRRRTARRDFLIEYNSDTVFPRMQKAGYRAVRTAEWKLIHYVDTPGMDELYNLRNDPYELQNLSGKSEWRGVEQKLAARLRELAPGL